VQVSDERVAKRFFVGGLVQGVGYRYFAQRTAARLGLAGYAKNLPDGRVEVYAVGTLTAIDSLHARLRRGPQTAQVSGVEVEQASIDPRFAQKFSIEYGE
jgi:acylphosphatase